MNDWQNLHPEQIGEYMRKNISRIKSELRTMTNPVDRFNFIIDQTPDTRWGIKMCDNLMLWARENGGVKQPDYDKSQFSDGVGDIPEVEDEEWEKLKREAKRKVAEANAITAERNRKKKADETVALIDTDETAGGSDSLNMPF